MKILFGELGKVRRALDSTRASIPHLRHLARTYRLAKPSLGCATGVLVLQVECRSDRARRSPRAERSELAEDPREAGSSFCVTLICALAFATHAHIKAPAYCRYFDRPTHRRKSWPRPSRSHVTCPRRHPRPVGPLSAHRLTSSRQPSRQCRNRPRSAGPAPSRPV